MRTGVDKESMFWEALERRQFLLRKDKSKTLEDLGFDSLTIWEFEQTLIDTFDLKEGVINLQKEMRVSEILDIIDDE